MNQVTKAIVAGILLVASNAMADWTDWDRSAERIDYAKRAAASSKFAASNYCYLQSNRIMYNGMEFEVLHPRVGIAYDGIRNKAVAKISFMSAVRIVNGQRVYDFGAVMLQESGTLSYADPMVVDLNGGRLRSDLQRCVDGSGYGENGQSVAYGNLQQSSSLINDLFNRFHIP